MGIRLDGAVSAGRRCGEQQGATSVDKDGVVGAIAHQVGIADMVLDEPSPKNDHAYVSERRQ